MIQQGLLKESAKPIVHRIERHIQECARDGKLFTTEEILNRVRRWSPMREAVVGVSRDYGQLGLPAVIHYGLVQFVHACLNAIHPDFDGVPSYLGLPMAGSNLRAYKGSEWATSKEIRQLILPRMRSIAGQEEIVKRLLALADRLDQNHALNGRELLLKKTA